MAKKILSYILLAFLLFGAGLMLYSLEYFFDYFTYFQSGTSTEAQSLWLRRDIDFWLAKRDKIGDDVWAAALYLHILGSLTAIVIGPFQFMGYLRKRFLGLHRILGKVYVGGILFLGVPTGYYMAVFANGGSWAIVGFMLLSSLWLYSTWRAYSSARNRNIAAHQVWMIRSYAVTFAAVMLRVWTALLPDMFGLSFSLTVVLAAWLSWVPNVVAAEGIIWLGLRRK